MVGMKYKDNKADRMIGFFHFNDGEEQHGFTDKRSEHRRSY